MNVSMPHPIEELDEQAQLMRVSWKKAFNYHSNLAKTLLEVKAAIETGRFGPEWTTEKWLLRKAGLFQHQLVKKILVYSKLMASEDREKLEADKEEAARKRRDKAEEKRQDAAAARVAARLRREREAKAREQEKQERAAAKAEAKRHKTAQAKAARAEAAKQKRVAAKPTKPAERQATAPSPGLAPAARAALLVDMATEIRDGHAETERGRETWISGSVRMAAALAAAREQFPGDPAFGKWMKENNLPGSPNDRRALIHMGRHLEEARFILATTKRRSYELIWRRELKPQLEEESLPHDKSCTNFSAARTARFSFS